MTFNDASPAATLVASDPLSGSGYGQVEYQNLYAGVSLDFFTNAQGQLEYDYRVAPGASAASISAQYQGDTSLTLDGQGDLLITTPGSGLVQYAPQLYQVVNGSQVAVSGSFTMTGPDQVGFQMHLHFKAEAPLLHSRSYLKDPKLINLYDISINILYTILIKSNEHKIQILKEIEEFPGIQINSIFQE